MTESLLRLLQTYGSLTVFAATLLGCSGFSVPGSLVLLAACSFVASGETALATALIGGLASAIIGDQAVAVWELTVVKLSCSACPGDPSLLRPWALPGHSHFAGEDSASSSAGGS